MKNFWNIAAVTHRRGYRILVLAHSEQETKGTERPTGLEPLGLFLITDVIREEAPDTLAFFDSQGVDLKVISGDDPVTVSAIAKKAGLKNANHYIDATTIKNFGRNAACSCRVQCIRACNTSAEETDGTGSSVTEAYSCDDR